MRKWRPYRATKLEILEFFDIKSMVFIYLLVEEFGYTYLSAQKRLGLLKKEGLVTNNVRGMWVLTSEGVNKLLFLRERAKQRRLQPAPDRARRR